MTTRPRSGPELTAMAKNNLVADTFVSLADTMVDDFDVVEVLTRLAQTCVRVFDASEAGLLLVDHRGNLHQVASSAEPMHLLDLMQIQVEEGPCVDTVRTGEPVMAADVDGEHDRWPRFAKAAVAAGFGSVYAIPLRLRTEIIGGLHLYRTEALPLSADHQHVARALADVAALGILQHRTIQRTVQVAEQLQAALISRVVIEQAKGVLVGHNGVTLDEAFNALRGHARRNRRKLAQVANDVARGVITAESLLGHHQDP